jgi:hypothetical protein
VEPADDKSPAWLGWLKQLQAFLSAALPFVTAKISLYPFQNVVADLWPITSVLAFLLGAITFNMVEPRPQSVHGQRLELIGWILGVAGSLMAVVSLLLMLCLVSEVILLGDSTKQYLAGEFMFVSEFVCLGIAVGFLAGLISRRFFPTTAAS